LHEATSTKRHCEVDVLEIETAHKFAVLNSIQIKVATVRLDPHKLAIDSEKGEESPFEDILVLHKLPWHEDHFNFFLQVVQADILHAV